jgi:two-component system nitrogen regulation sensor histidine kinase GlnL
LKKLSFNILSRRSREGAGAVRAQPRRISIKSGLWRDVVDNLTDALLVVSEKSEPITLNPAAETLLGISSVNLLLIAELMRLNSWLQEMIRNCLERGQSVSRAEAQLKWNQRMISVCTEVSPLLDPRGNLCGAIVLLHDLSYQKSIGQRLAVEPGEAQLGLSPAGLAHELKNPLTGIKGAAELLAAMFPGDQRAQQYCTLIMDGANRLTGLAEQVLSVSAPQRLKRQSINIHKLLHQALALAGLHPERSTQIKIEQIFDPSLPDVSGDPAALERVFLNLIKNAIEAIESAGTIRLVTRMETEFHLSTQGRRRQFLRVEISDSGKGITAEQRAQLFTPFFTTKPEGTGLGLVLSHRIVALHGGKLWAEPSEHSAITGMTFKVSLPMATEAEGSPEFESSIPERK